MTITTIAENDRRSGPYTATAAQTVFTYDFPIYDEGDIEVVRVRDDVEEILTLATDYTVTGVEDPAGGTIVLTAGSDADDSIAINGAMPRVATAYFQDGGDFTAADINRDRNRLVMMLQEQDVTLAEALALAEAAVSADDMEAAITAIVGTVTDNAANAEASAAASAVSAAAAQDALEALLSGGGLADAPVSPAMQPVVAAATLANARTELGLGTAAAAASGDFVAAGTAALKASNLSDLANAATARTNLGLGTLAVAGAGSGLEISGGNARLTDTAVVAGTYGDADNVPQIVVDAKGRITGVTEVPINAGTPAWLALSSASGTTAVAAVDFALTSGYSRFRFDLRDVKPSTSAQLSVRFSFDGGASYVSSVDYGYQVHNFGGSGANDGSATRIALHDGNQSSSEQAFGHVDLDVADKILLAHIRTEPTNGHNATGTCGTAGTPTHIRFLYSTGNVARHDIKMSGMV